MSHSRLLTPMSATSPSLPTTAGELPPIVRDFLERLRHLPLGVWADAAQAPPGDARGSASGGPPTAFLYAQARLRRVMNGMPRVATQTAKRVQHLVAVAEGIVHRRTVPRMRKAALTSALALAARPLLDEEDFARLYAPFARLIPVDAIADDRQESPRPPAAR